MKKNIVILCAATMMLASCGTYAGAGAGQGAYFGGILGSAIGGITGGHRGHDLGTILGMAGGAALGAAIGSAADDQRASDLEMYQAEKARLAANRRARQNQQTVTTTTTTTTTTVPEGYSYEQGAIQDSGFDSTNSADDRIELDLSDNSSSDYNNGGSSVETITAETGSPVVEIRNARFVDGDGDNEIARGESSNIVFEIYNSGTATAYNLQPTVLETTGNKHILVSPAILIENLGAGKGVRYTARVVADKSLKEGVAQFSVAVVQGSETLTKVVKFTVPTKK